MLRAKEQAYAFSLEIIQWCEFDQLTLEIAFGGGEPTLFPGLAEVCRRIWTETQLGISITTHGHHLNEELWKSLKGFVSIVRVSIDAPEPLYTAIRGLPLAGPIRNIRRIEEQVPIGINTVVNTQTLGGLDELAVMVRDLELWIGYFYRRLKMERLRFRIRNGEPWTIGLFHTLMLSTFGRQQTQGLI